MPESGVPSPQAPPESPVMNEEQIALERRRGKIAGIAAIAAVALIFAGNVWSRTIDTDDTGGKPVIKATPHAAQGGKADSKKDTQQKKQAEPTKAEEQKASADAKKKADDDKRKAEDDRDTVDELASAHRQRGAFLGFSIVTGLGLMLLLFPVLHLQRAIAARKPDAIAVLKVAAVYAPLAIGISTIIRAFAVADASVDFSDMSFVSLDQAADKARDMQTEGALFVSSQALALSGALAFVIWLIKGNYDAYSTGLEPRMLSIIGMGLPLLVLLFLPIAIFWFLAIGALCMGYWPGGLPKAWTEGRAIPWPKRDYGGRGKPPSEAGGERNGDVDAVGPGVRKAGDSESDGSNIQRRKRKRRGG